MADAPGRRRIILVHGTWGRGFFPRSIETFPDGGDDILEEDESARWFHPTSRFRRSLSHWMRHYGVSADIEVFQWSGANSVYERDAAAQRLQDCLSASEVDTTIIAHSHGGNVALRAIHLLDDAKRQIELITLATPFLAMFLSPFQLAKTLNTVILSVALSVWISVPISNAIHSGLGFLIGFFLGLILINFLQYGIVNGGGIYTFWPFWSSWRGRPWRLVQASKTANAIKSTKLLVIRAIEDEPGLTLAAAAMGNRMTSLSLRALETNYAGASLVFVGIASFIAKTIDLNSTTAFLYVILTIGAASLFILPVVAGLFKSVFGRELAVGSSRVIVMADSVPDYIEATVVTLNPADVPALRHSVYETDLAPPVIALWMRHEKISNDLVKIVEDAWMIPRLPPSAW